MFLNILRISASNVLKTFFNVIVSIERTFINFHSHKPSGSTNQPEAQTRFNITELAATLAGTKEIF